MYSPDLDVFELFLARVRYEEGANFFGMAVNEEAKWCEEENHTSSRRIVRR